MLLFELFPAFMLVLSLVVAGALFLANRRAAGEPALPDERAAQHASRDDNAPPTSQRSSVRPSMRS